MYVIKIFKRFFAFAKKSVDDEHYIAERTELIAMLQSFVVGVHCIVVVAKGCSEHEQSGIRQVEV